MTWFDTSPGATPTAVRGVVLAAHGGTPVPALLTLGEATAIRRKRR
ncbi:MAG TPA: hypothetical protein PKH77_09645 [Anaerolineae bacterium]|nr:hypothetical protein [Anaerolineae bacterium]